MDIFWFSFNGIFPVCLIVGLGYFLKRIAILDDQFIVKANRFCFMVAFPLQLFYNIYHIDYSRKIPVGMLIFLTASILLMTIGLSLIVPLTIRDSKKRGSFVQGVFRSNFLLIGLPLAKNLFGDAGVLAASIALPVVIPLYNFLAVVVLTGFSNDRPEGEEKVSYSRLLVKIAKNPLIITSILALGLALLHLEIPLFLDRGIKDVGSIATPLALVLLGGQFRFEDLRGRLKLAVIASLMRTVVMPAILILIAISLGFRDEELGTIFIVTAAPSAISGYVMAISMGNDGELSGQIIILTTLLSAITMFTGVYTLRWAGLF